MRHKLVFCSLLLVIAFTGVAAAKSSRDDNEGSSSRLREAGIRASTSLNRLPYKNLLDSSKWSRLIHGRALTATLKKKNAHSAQDVDSPCTECDLLFAPDDVYGGEMIGPLSELNAGKLTSSGGCNWGCCFKICVASAMDGAGNLCTTSCTACGLTGNSWPCAVCVGCGTVGFVAIEFCGLHCCVNPGGC